MDYMHMSAKHWSSTRDLQRAPFFSLPNLRYEDWIESVYLEVFSLLGASRSAQILFEKKLQPRSTFNPSDVCTKIKTTELLSSVAV